MVVVSLAFALAASLPVPVCGLARDDVVAYEPLYGAAGDAVGERFLVYGGQGARGLSRDLLVFDAATLRPTVVNVRGGTARRYHAVVANGDWIYVFGGERDGTTPPTERIHTGTWAVETRAALPVPRAFVSAAKHDDRIYVVGGSMDGQRVARVDVYDPATDTWSEGPPLSEPRDTRVVDVDGTLYAVGGYRGGGVGSVVVERLAPKARAWERVADLPAPSSAYSVVALGGRIHVLGDYTAQGRAFTYDVTADAWSPAPASFVPRRHAAAVAAHGRAILVGGNVRTKGPGTAVIERFTAACAPVAGERCEVLRDRADDTATLTHVRDVCGIVIDLDRKLASALLAKGERRAALSVLARGLTTAGASPATFALLARLTRAGLSADEHALLQGLGRTPTSPLFVPTIDLEYRWLNTFGCGPKRRPKRERQALRYDGLDVFEISCDGAPAPSVYFDFSTLATIARGGS